MKLGYRDRENPFEHLSRSLYFQIYPYFASPERILDGSCRTNSNMRQLVSQIAIMPDGIVVKLTLGLVSQTFSTRRWCKFISNIRFVRAEDILYLSIYLSLSPLINKDEHEFESSSKYTRNKHTWFFWIEINFFVFTNKIRRIFTIRTDVHIRNIERLWKRYQFTNLLDRNFYFYSKYCIKVLYFRNNTLTNNFF